MQSVDLAKSSMKERWSFHYKQSESEITQLPFVSFFQEKKACLNYYVVWINCKETHLCTQEKVLDYFTQWRHLGLLPVSVNRKQVISAGGEESLSLSFWKEVYLQILSGDFL